MNKNHRVNQISILIFCLFLCAGCSEDPEPNEEQERKPLDHQNG